MSIKVSINSTTTNFKLDTVKALRTFDVSVGDKFYITEIFTGDKEYNLSIVDGKIVVKGSALQDEFVRLSKLVGYSKMKLIEYEESLSDSDSIFKENYATNLLSFIKDNKKSNLLPAMILKQFWSADLETINTIFDSFDSSVHDNFYLKKLAVRKKNLEKTAIGQSAPNFTLKSIKGTKISLKDFKDKYVLVDFWAYWCGPCIEGFPELRKIRKQYSEDKLEIVSISTDKNKKEWVKAVEKHRLPWTQLLDDNSNVSDLYAVTGIPHFLLISPEGKIIYLHNHLNNLIQNLTKILN